MEVVAVTFTQILETVSNVQARPEVTPGRCVIRNASVPAMQEGEERGQSIFCLIDSRMRNKI